jgi:Flp pilus assembly protein TadB
METAFPNEGPDLESRWRARQTYWRRTLGRLRLGVESIEEQLVRYRRVTWALTAVPVFLAVFFLSLFTAFGRPDIGVILIAILLLPIVVFAWLDYARLARRAASYEAELQEYLREKERLTVIAKPNSAASESA